MWRHMNEKQFWIRHITLFLPRVMVWDIKNGNLNWTKASIRAISKINKIITRRLRNPKNIRATAIIKESEKVYYL
jgi:hypothetical protein